MSQEDVAEYVAHSCYAYDDDTQSKHPLDGETRPNYTGPQPPYDHLDTDNKYSWVKAPRFQDEPMEVGPLAHMLIGYASGHERRLAKRRRFFDFARCI